MKKEIRIELEDRIDELEKILKNKHRAVEGSPSGKLRVAKSKKQYQYFIRTTEEKTGKYISKTNMALAIKLAQKEYDSKLIKSAERERNYIKYILSKDKFIPCEDIYETMHPAKRILVSPAYVSDEDYIYQWLHQEIDRFDDNYNNAVYETNKGDVMRSKSELLIMSILEKYEIPYIYMKNLYI